MTDAARYLELTERTNRLKERRAVLLAKEAEKAKQRESLTAELKAAGLDTNQPEKEIARLEAETAADLRAAEERVSQFERELDAAEKGPTPIPALLEDLAKKSLQAHEAEPTIPKPATTTPKETINESLLDDLEIS